MIDYERWLQEFREKLIADNKSDGTIKTYCQSMTEYFRWFSESYGDTEFKGLYRANINEYKSYLRNIKTVRNSGNHLDAQTINGKIAALVKFNELLQPEEIVISDKDYIKIQQMMINPTDLTKQDVEEFRQQILQAGGCTAARNYAIATLLAYAGVRISESLDLKETDVSIAARQIRVRGKGDKQRIVIINSKIVDALSEYYKLDTVESEYVFHNSKGDRLNRTTINKAFNEFSDKITPHGLRHFYCTNALESGVFSINEVAMQAGHSDIRTTMRYTNPNLSKMMEKAERL